MSKEQSEDLQKDEEPFGLSCALEVFTEVDEVLLMIDNLKKIILMQQSYVERAHERFACILGQYQEQPHLLDLHIDFILERLINIVREPNASLELKHETFKYMYVIINVRGYKVIIRHLPHEVADFEPVLQLLETQDPSESATWTTRYVLLLWLSIIVMIPFHMSRLDGFEESRQKTVMDRMMDVCKTYVIVADKCRDAASYLNSRFLTRADVKELHMDSYLHWAMELATNKESNTFIKYGILSSISMLLKHGKREDLLPYATLLLQWIINEEFKTDPGTNIQKFVYKIVQRIGLTFLPPRVATWRYQRGNRSLAANLSAGDGKTAATSVGIQQEIGQDTHEDIDVPDEIEEVIDQLIQGLQSNDGIVRWSAAKGIGRVTGRLSKDLADEVVGSVLELFNPREGDGAWHGGCLALAELGRRGLLLPQRLPEVVPVLLKALMYDEPRGYSSVGSHIRDAACYVAWSFARAYDMDVLRPFVQDIASAILIVTCFDREINCRRAASAAFQENVGRQGTFPHGIDILTTADFFSVSVRNNSYLNISVYIAQFEEYTIPLIDHLIERKVDHWDVVIRELTAKALHNLTPSAPDYMTKSVLPQLFDKATSIDLNCRHGSVIAIGEILWALSKVVPTDANMNELVGMDLIDKAKRLIPLFQERLYFRGMGGELMKQACCIFIENCSLAHMPFYKMEIIDEWLKLLDECLSYNAANIRSAAVAALPAFFSVYLNDNSQESAEKQDKVIKNYTKALESDTCQITRMGHALAIGALPKFLLKNHLNTVTTSLINSTSVTIGTLKWSESRRDAIKALTSICVTLDNDICTDLTDAQINKICNCFFNGLNEYTQDKRGDIGAWVREASMTALQTLTMLLVKHKVAFLTETLITKITANIAQQAVERIDRTRALAGRIFYNFVHNELVIPNIPHHEELKRLFPKEECELFNWNSATITFPKFVELLEYEEYKYHLLLGLISSVGGMTETLVKSASSSLFHYLENKQEETKKNEMEKLCDLIYSIFVQFQRNDRIVIPLLRFLDRLFCSGCLNCIIEDSESDFSKKILKLIQAEINGCKDIYKLVDGINVLCQFIQIKTEVCSTALVQLSILLCHKQTYVRRSTSTKLYESLLVYGDNSIIPPDNLDEIMSLLSSTNWEDPVEKIKPARNQLCTLMGVRIPVPKIK